MYDNFISNIEQNPPSQDLKNLLIFFFPVTHLMTVKIQAKCKLFTAKFTHASTKPLIMSENYNSS